tara:strand:- start:581 stop:979 length:399 start_codon:yes stop_codon:yes gene_type:complete
MFLTKILRPLNSYRINMRYLNSSTQKNYTETMEWWINLPNGNSRIGLSQEAVEKLSDLVYIEFDNIDFNKIYLENSPICEIESVKAVENIYSPFDCKIISYNKELEDDLDIINSDPENDNNWILEIKIEEKI